MKRSETALWAKPFVDHIRNMVNTISDADLEKLAENIKQELLLRALEDIADDEYDAPQETG